MQERWRIHYFYALQCVKNGILLVMGGTRQCCKMLGETGYVKAGTVKASTVKASTVKASTMKPKFEGHPQVRGVSPSSRGVPYDLLGQNSRIAHGIIFLGNLRKRRVNQTLIRWIDSSLSDRSSTLKLQEYTAPSAPIQTGIPQG